MLKLKDCLEVDVETSKYFIKELIVTFDNITGWWQYDERTSLELESAYQKAERCCELLIAGFLYIADFDSMLQYRRNDPSRRRRIKRDLATICSKGIAGLKATKDTVPLSSSTDLVSNVLIPDLQNLHISGQPLLTPLHNTNLSALSNLNSLSSSQSISRMVPDFRHTERNLSLVGSHDVPLYYSNLQVEPVTNNIHAARNLDIDPSLSNRLDWTIEQIEALNLELSNDYENLFRDVNNLSSLHDTTNSSGTNNEASNSLINSPRRGHVSVASNSTFTSVQGSSRRIPSSNEHLPVTQNAVSPTITERILVRPSVLTNVDCPQSLTRPLQKLSRSKHKKLSPK